MKSLIQSISALGAADTTNTTLERLQALYGSTSDDDGSGTSLANSIAVVETAIASLAATPGSASLQANAVSALDSLASQLRETSSGIQDLRSDADQSIAIAVDDVNEQLNDHRQPERPDQAGGGLQPVHRRSRRPAQHRAAGDRQPDERHLLHLVVRRHADLHRRPARRCSTVRCTSCPTPPPRRSPRRRPTAPRRRAASAASWSTASTSPRRSAPGSIGALITLARHHAAGGAGAARPARDHARRQPERRLQSRHLAAAAADPDRHHRRSPRRRRCRPPARCASP